MTELSLHALDIAQNSIRAAARNILILTSISSKDNRLQLVVQDDGYGIDEVALREVKNPFVTSNGAKEIGLGIPLFNDTCEQCGGRLEVESIKDVGTTINAYMMYDHIDRPPLGDMPMTIANLIISNPDINILYQHRKDDQEFKVCSKQVKTILGDRVSLTNPQVYDWIINYINENIRLIENANQANVDLPLEALPLV